MKIMTGKTGTPHVTSQQFRQLIEGTVGQDSYILLNGENLEPELQTNNLLKIRSGMMSHHGNLSVVDVGTYDEVTIANGTQGMQRIDLVVNRYTRNESSGIEENTWVVLQGAPAASNPQVPEYTKGNLQDGALVDDCPVFEVHLNGINVTEVKKLLEIAKTPEDIRNDIYIDLDADIETVATSYGMTVLHKKVGSLHTIRIAGDLAGALTTHTFSIPEGCRPTQAVYEMTRIGNIWCEVRILSSGEVRLTADSTVNGGSYINKWLTYA